MSELKFGAVAIAIGVMLCQSHVLAQVAASPSSTETSVTLSGTIKDGSGKPLDAIALKLKRADGGTVATAITGAAASPASRLRRVVGPEAGIAPPAAGRVSFGMM